MVPTRAASKKEDQGDFFEFKQKEEELIREIQSEPCHHNSMLKAALIDNQALAFKEGGQSRVLNFTPNQESLLFNLTKERQLIIHSG